MKKIMIAAMESGSGKTVFTCGLIRALLCRGFDVIPFKCGPDYIDPMYLKKAAGAPCRNLDLFLQGQDGVRKSFERGIRSVGRGQNVAGESLGQNRAEETTINGREAFAVTEGVMGYYDGLSGTTESSSYELADILDIPVILLVKQFSNSVTLAAQIKGVLEYKKPSHISGIVFSGCSESYYNTVSPIIERDCGIRVFGFFSKTDEAVIPSRHLGLLTADEQPEIVVRFDAIKDMIEENVNVQDICGL